jgi:centromeric protein E
VQARQKLEDEKKALQLFVSDIELIQSKPRSQLPRPSIGGAIAFAESRKKNLAGLSLTDTSNSPFKIDLGKVKGHGSLLEQMPEEIWEDGSPAGGAGKVNKSESSRSLCDKENIPACR